MPALVWWGRAWRVGSDDFAFSSILYAGLLAGGGILSAACLTTGQQNYLDSCEGASVAWGRAMMGITFVDLASTVLFLCTAVLSCRGAVFEVSKRRSVPVLLYIDTAAIVCVFVLSCLSAKYAIYDSQTRYCTRAVVRQALRGSIALNLGTAALYIASFVVAFDPSGRRVYHSNDDYTRAWWKRLRICCCCRWWKHRKAEDVYTDVAQIFASAFRGYDIVPSDIAAGMLLLHGYQSCSRALLSSMVHYGPHPKGYAEHVSSQARPALRLTTQQRAGVRELQQYSRFFIAAYGWMLFEFQHCGTGVARLCCLDPCMACRSRPSEHEGQRCFCDVTALLQETRLPEEDLLLTSWTNEVFKPVHYVAYDSNTDAVIIAIRGSMSVEDCITDFAALPVTLTLFDTPPGVSPGEYYAHSGMVRCAQYILDHLREKGILQLLLHGRFAAKRVIVLGHSLGAGVSLILSAMLWSDFAALRTRLRCLAYSPPGGSVSRAVMEYQKEFVLAACMGYDMIPRLAPHTFDVFREAVFDVLAASSLNKNVVFLNVWRTGVITKPIHPSTPVESQTLRSVESATYRESLRHPLCGLTQENRRLFNCLEMIHFVKTVAVRKPSWCWPGMGCSEEEVYIPVMCDIGTVQMLLASPTMFTDHFPDRFYRVMQKSVQMLEEGELERFYVDDAADVEQVLPAAPMHFIASAPVGVHGSRWLSDYGGTV